MTTAARLSTHRCAALLPLLFAQIASAQPPSPIEEAPGPSLAQTAAHDQWRVEFSPYLWALGIEGDMGVRGQSASVAAYFFDIVAKSDSIFALAGRLEVGKGKVGGWGGFIDAGYSSVSVDNATGPLGVADVDIEYQQTIVDFGVTYRLGEWGTSGGQGRSATLDAYAGARYTSVDLTISPALLPERTGSRSWLDPIIGIKAVVPLGESWHIAANADIGGFGVASEFTWSGTAVVGYDFELWGLRASAYAGYRALGWDYTHGTGTDEFTWDILEHGVTFGLTFRF